MACNCDQKHCIGCKLKSKTIFISKHPFDPCEIIPPPCDIDVNQRTPVYSWREGAWYRRENSKYFH